MVYKGNDKITEIYYGTTPIVKIYKGTNLVYKRTPTILTLNDYVPAANVRVPDGITSSYVRDASGTKTYKWNKTLTPGTYTFRFNYQTGMGAGLGEKKDVVTYTVASVYQSQPAFYWQNGTSLFSYIYLSTTGFKIVYQYHENSLDNKTWVYSSYANRYVTSVELIEEDD